MNLSGGFWFMDHGLSDERIRAADADVLVGAAESAHHMSLEVG